MSDLPFPKSLPDFQRLFPDDSACAKYLEAIRFRSGFECPHCRDRGEPGRIATRPHVLRCRSCRKETRLMAGTVMQDSHTPMSVWFWGAYLLSSLTPGMSAVQFQRQLGLTRYETAFQILHKLRAGMVRPGRDRIGGGRVLHDRLVRPRGRRVPRRPLRVPRVRWPHRALRRPGPGRRRAAGDLHGAEVSVKPPGFSCNLFPPFI